MILFDFAFFQPNTVTEARNIYEQYTKDGKNVTFYSGGTEFISRARTGEIAANVVIDLKNIPECQVYEIKNNQLFIGSAVALCTITDNVLFPLLSKVVNNIATRTARNKITIGGNLCSNLPYKEALLPFLLAESKINIATKNGIETRPITDILHLSAGEILLQIITDANKLNQSIFYEKRTKQAKVNYPIITMVAMKNSVHIQVAMTGFTKQPFSFQINPEQDLITLLKRKEILELNKEVLHDHLASKAYRIFVYQTMLKQILTEGIAK